MLERFFKRKKLERTISNAYIEILKAEIKEKDKTIIEIKEFIKKELTEYDLINMLINYYGWEEHTNTYNNFCYSEKKPFCKFSEIKLTLEKKMDFNMEKHLKEVLKKEN